MLRAMKMENEENHRKESQWGSELSDVWCAWFDQLINTTDVNKIR